MSGKRPAILTSTIWALAQQSPSIIPDRITVVTTTTGREAIRRELFTSPASRQLCVWDSLRAALIDQGHVISGRLLFGDTAEDIRVFTIPSPGDRSKELEDMRSTAHYEQAADQLLDIVRTFTEVDDTRLFASVSGGRKPLVSLLAGVLGFLGRPQDRRIHVLVNEPFDSPTLRPGLYFPPSPPAEHHYVDARSDRECSISSSSARLEVVDVPFVRLRRLFAHVPQFHRSRYSVLARA